MKRKGFREQWISLTPYYKFNIGVRLFVAGLAMVMMNWGVMALALLLPIVPTLGNVLPLRVSFDKKGLEGDELALIEKLEKRMGELPDIVTADSIMEQVRSTLSAFLDEDNKPKFDVEQLIQLLGEDDKGFRSILKKQGEEIAALKAISSGGQAGKMELRSILDKFFDKEKDKLSNMLESRSGQVRLNIRAAAAMTTLNTIEGHDSLPDDLIESFSIGQFVPKRFPREYVFDMANRRTVSEVTQYKTWLEEGDEEGAFALVEEGGLKPLISYSLVRNHSEYQKVAGKYVVTEEFAKFRREAYNIIQRLITNKILRDYAAILTTNLLNDAVPYTGSALDGEYTDPTDYHAIAAVAAQIEGLDFMPDLLIVNPQDKWRIGMQQGSNGHFYLTIPTTDPSGVTRIMGFTVRSSNRLAPGTFILGESGLWEIEDEPLSIRMGFGIDVTSSEGTVTAVESDFDHNRFRVIVETYFHNYIATPNIGSFVVATYDEVKEALASGGGEE